MVDEADEANFGQQPVKKRHQESPTGSPGPKRRKAGQSTPYSDFVLQK